MAFSRTMSLGSISCHPFRDLLEPVESERRAFPVELGRAFEAGEGRGALHLRAPPRQYVRIPPRQRL